MGYFCGIDPGLDGGLVLLDEGGEWAEAHAVPIVDGEAGPRRAKPRRAYDLGRMSEIFRGASIERAALEQARSYPGQGHVGPFRTGLGFACWAGILAAFRIPSCVPTPQAWRKAVLGVTGRRRVESEALVRLARGQAGRGAVKAGRKAASLEFATRRWPKLVQRARERHGAEVAEGLAEAACLAEFARLSPPAAFEGPLVIR